MQIQPWEYGMKATPAREWSEGMGSLIAVAMFLGGIAGGLYLVSLFFDNLWGMFIAWIFALGMGVFDMAHLSKPMRVWRIAAKANSSWISRGFIFVLLFIGAAGLQLLISWLTDETTGAEVFFRVVSGILAFGVAVYSGFVVGYVSGIKFWNSALMPVLVVFGGLAGGTITLLVVAAFSSSGVFGDLQVLSRLTLVVYILSIFIFLWISAYSGPVAKESAKQLVGGNLAGLFWIVIILIGILLPFVLSFLVNSDSQFLAIVSAVSALLGYLGLRFAILKAGKYSPLVNN